MMTARAVARILAAAALAVLLAPSVARADDEILIEAKGVRPPVLHTTTAHRVTFVNRSGRLAHLEFTGDPGAHKVFQVPGQMWAVFHVPGRHPYAVHLESGGDTVTLQGVVEVTVDPGGRPDLPTCDSESVNGRTIMGPCFVW